MSASQLGLEAALQDLDASRGASVADQEANNRPEHIPPPALEHLQALCTWMALNADMPPSTSSELSLLYVKVLRRLLEYRVPSLAPFARRQMHVPRLLQPFPTTHLIASAFIAARLMCQRASCWLNDKQDDNLRDRLNWCTRCCICP